ncbi:hypothetical protein V8C42DRAFT_359479 [Trichoderma barbatum]
MASAKFNRNNTRRQGRSSSAGVKRPSNRLFLVTTESQSMKQAPVRVGISLYFRLAFFHWDISIKNLLLHADKEITSYPAFLIDPYLAIKTLRERSTGAKAKTGTRAFMAIGVLLGEQHSFMHNLESFFWNKSPTEFDCWNYGGDQILARLKPGTVVDESIFLSRLIPCVNRLRKQIFPSGQRRKKESLDLYAEMTEVLETARETLAHYN